MLAADRMADVDSNAPGERLVDDAVPLRRRDERIELLFARVRVELEPQPDLFESHRRLAVHPHRAAEVEIALGDDPAAREPDVAIDRHRTERDPRAGDERLEQHVPGAGETPVPTARGVQAGLDERAAGLDGAG